MDYDVAYGKKSISLEQEDSALNNFYRLHYPCKKHGQAVSKASNKMRSKSVISVIHSPSNQQTELNYSPKNSICKLMASKQLNSQRNIPSPNKLSPIKYKQIISFKSFLSAKNHPRDTSMITLPLNSMKDIQQLSKRNMNVRMAIQRSRDQKIKMNKIVMSHKQSQEVKLEYLKVKKNQIQDMINREIGNIYEQFFKKQYQVCYGDEGEDKFQGKLAQLVSILSKNVFAD